MNHFKSDSENPKHCITSHHIYHDYPHFHTHDYWEFVIVTDGSYRHEINGISLNAGVRDAYLIRPEDFHALFNENPKSGHLNILIQSEAMQKTCDFISPSLMAKLKAPKFLEASLSPHQIKRITDVCNLLRFGKGLSEDEYQMHSQLLLGDIVSIVFEQNIFFRNDRPKWLNEILAEIQRPENAHWSVADVLSRVDYSHARFASLFKHHMGMPLVSYLAEVKMNAAHDYLLHSSLSMGEIAERLGYESNSHFNHVFHKFYGVSPTQYRKQRKGASGAKAIASTSAGDK